MIITPKSREESIDTELKKNEDTQIMIFKILRSTKKKEIRNACVDTSLFVLEPHPSSSSVFVY